jgi:hypothetical protein
MGECELHLDWHVVVVDTLKADERRGDTASCDGRVPLASDRATEERYMGTCVVCLCVAAQVALQGSSCVMQGRKKKAGKVETDCCGEMKSFALA